MVVLEWLFEYWLPIRGYEGLYEVSNWGRVRSVDRYVKQKGMKDRFYKSIILRPEVSRNGYLLITLCKERVKTTYSVHSIVAQTFLLNPNNYPQINHKDENKINNCVWNLEWCTAQYNLTYGTRLERYHQSMLKAYEKRKKKLRPLSVRAVVY